MSDAGKESVCINPYCGDEGTVMLAVFGREVGLACAVCVSAFTTSGERTAQLEATGTANEQ